jgi:hypothetical protein
MDSLIYTPTGLVVDSMPDFADYIDWRDYLIDTMTFSIGGLSDNSSIEKVQTVNQLAVDCVEDDFVTIDCYFDAVAELAEIDPYAFLSL